MSKTAKKSTSEPSKKSSSSSEDYITSLSDFWRKYSSESSPRVKLIDWFSVFLTSLIAVQFFYRLVVGDDFPKNAFLTGVFCPLGVIILLMSIRQN